MTEGPASFFSIDCGSRRLPESNSGYGFSAMGLSRPSKRIWILTVVGVLTTLAAVGGYCSLLHWQAEAIARQSLRPPMGGSLLICGGGATSDEIMDRFVEMAGGREARLVVIPSFEPSPVEAMNLAQSWKSRGVAAVFVLCAATRSQSNDLKFIEPLCDATAVWITGGEQGRLTELYVDTEVERQLKALLERRGVIGGTSAGAAAMSRVMIAGGRDRAIEQRGFDLLTGVAIDQHFFRRNRAQRLLGILAAHPGLVGLGVDENTALIVHPTGRTCRVIGKSYAMVCLPAEPSFPRIEILKPGDVTDLQVLRQVSGDRAISSATDLDEFLNRISAR